jgi:hypothetical protein
MWRGRAHQAGVPTTQSSSVRLPCLQEPQAPYSDDLQRATYSAGDQAPEGKPPAQPNATNVQPFLCIPRETLRCASHKVVYTTDGSKPNPERAGAGIFPPNSIAFKLEMSRPLPVKGALLEATPTNPTWRGYTFIGVQNSS